MRAYIAGFDISTTCVGWALLSLDYAVDKDLRYGKIIPPRVGKNQGTWFQRADYIYAEVEKLIAAVPICAVGIEELNSMRGAETTRQLAGVNMGVQYIINKRFGVQPSMMWTSTMKKAFSGSGNAKKWHMIDAANRIYGLDLRWPALVKDQKNKKLNDEDVADALACAFALDLEIGDELRNTLKEGA